VTNLGASEEQLRGAHAVLVLARLLVVVAAAVSIAALGFSGLVHVEIDADAPRIDGHRDPRWPEMPPRARD